MSSETKRIRDEIYSPRLRLRDHVANLFGIETDPLLRLRIYRLQRSFIQQLDAIVKGEA